MVLLYIYLLIIFWFYNDSGGFLCLVWVEDLLGLLTSKAGFGNGLKVGEF